MQTMFETMQSQFLEEVHKSTKEIQAQVSAQKEEVKEEVHEIREKFETTAQEQAALRLQVEEMQKLLALADRHVPVASLQEEQDFNRDADPLMYDVHCQDIVSPKELLASMDQWLAEAKVQADWIKIHGAVPNRNFRLEVLGGASAASRSVALHRALRSGGSWREFSAKSVEGAFCRVYINPDRSQRTIRQEIQTRRLARLLQDKYPDKEWKAT